jgi:hypothetical protein
MFNTNIFRLLGVAAFLVCLAAAAFAQGGGIKGKVRSSKGGAIANATITARLDGKDVKTVHSDAKGSFILKGLDSGVYNVVFDADGFSSGVKYGVEIKNNNIRDLGDRLILSVDQGTLVLIKGSVFFKEGTSVTGAKVELERVNADGSTKRLGSMYTNVSGEFTFRQPEAAAKFRVTAKFKDASGTKDVEVTNAAIYRLAINLDISRQEK